MPVAPVTNIRLGEPQDLLRSFNTIRNNNQLHHHQMAGPQGGLCEAARSGDLGLVKTLLEKGEQINQVDIWEKQ